MAYAEVINGLNLKDTELCLGMPGTDEQAEVSCVKSNKRQFHQSNDEHNLKEESSPPPAKTQIVGWPPVRSNRKNNNKSLLIENSLYLFSFSIDSNSSTLNCCVPVNTLHIFDHKMNPFSPSDQAMLNLVDTDLALFYSLLPQNQHEFHKLL
ncbi:hypothetical protein Bca101_059845 [Brassica carinata]